MTSAQLILVSVSSALIAVIAMLVVATVLRARTRESTGSEFSPATGPQTRAQRAAARAQRKAQRAAMKAEKKSDKAAASVAKTEKRKAAALAAAKTKPTDEKPAFGSGSEATDKATEIKSDPKSNEAKKDEPEDASMGDKLADPSAAVAADRSATPDNTDELVVPDTRGRLGGTAEPEGGRLGGTAGPERAGEKDDEVATTEAGKRAAVAKPKARRSLLGRDRPADDSPENKS